MGNWQLGSAEGKAAALAQRLSVRLGHLGNQRAYSWYTEGAGNTVREGRNWKYCKVKQYGTWAGAEGTEVEGAGTWSENNRKHASFNTKEIPPPCPCPSTEFPPDHHRQTHNNNKASWKCFREPCSTWKRSQSSEKICSFPSQLNIPTFIQFIPKMGTKNSTWVCIPIRHLATTSLSLL